MSSEPKMELRRTDPSKSPSPPQSISTRQSIQPVNVDRFWSWFDNYLKVVIGIAVLGGQITFTVIASDIADPAKLHPIAASDARPQRFEKETVRLFIALAWLFFTLTLGIAVLTHLVFHGDGRGSMSPLLAGRFFGFVTFLLNFIPISAFLLLSLATAAYVPIVGWIGVVFISLFAFVALFFWWWFKWEERTHTLNSVES